MEISDIEKILGDSIKKEEEERRKIVEYISERLNVTTQFDNSEHLKKISDFLTGKTKFYKNEIYQIDVDGVPDYELADTEKDNLPLMLKICDKHINNLINNGVEPAPFYFERAAIIARKNKDYHLEVEICETYLQLMELYIEAHEKNGIKMYLNPRGCRYEKIAKRLPKAKQLLTKELNK